MIPRHKQQFGGAFMMVLGGAFTAWGWYTAMTQDYYYPMASVIFPTFCVIGLGLILFPGYKEERLARGEDISALAGVQLVTPRWWAVLIVATAAGAANYALLALR